jgi:hypothetical protein
LWHDDAWLFIGDAVVLPEPGKTEIDYEDFDGKDYTSVYVRDGVTTIGDSAFTSCKSSLVSVYIPKSVTTIGDSAFNGCTKLTSVVIPDRVRTIGKSAFEGCNGLTSITIGANVWITDDAFNGCPGNFSAVYIAAGSAAGVYIWDGDEWCANLL